MESGIIRYRVYSVFSGLYGELTIEGRTLCLSPTVVHSLTVPSLVT